ncbi:hypothetical protein [Sphaerisporangium perillae]|uniref:hypothetical protein n=1 Tax=Sphaerisporangium perillae TaxID=2935860 RepID=UPI00200EC853|nr:hypothetical protein [Sphaerisporangium perillae]
MNRLILVALMAVGVAAGVPAARASQAADTGADVRATSDPGRVQVSVSKVECPASKANVVMTAPRNRDTVEYSVYRGSTLVRNGILWPGVERTIPVYIEPRKSERVTVVLDGQGTTRYQVWSHCESGESGEESYGEYRESVYSESESSTGSSDRRSGGHRAEGVRSHRYNPLLRRQPLDRLPYTGPPADLYGKIATAVGMVVFGGMLWWIGMIWPRRTPAEPLLRPREAYGARRRPGRL